MVMINDVKLPLANVLNYVSNAVIETQNDNDQLLSWGLTAFRALNFLNLEYVLDIDFYAVVNHQLVLPKYIKTIQEVKMQVQNLDLFIDDNVVDYTESVFYNEFLNNDTYFKRLNEIPPIEMDYYCKISNLQYVYSLTHLSSESRIIQVPFTDAILMIKYYKPITDDCGDFLLPEEPIVFWEYLGAKIEEKHFKERTHRSEAGAAQLMMEARERAANYLTSTRRKINHANFSIAMAKKSLYEENDFTKTYSSMLDKYHKNPY